MSCTKDNIARTLARVSTKVSLPPMGSVHLNLTFACTRTPFTSVKLRNSFCFQQNSIHGSAELWVNDACLCSLLSVEYTREHDCSLIKKCQNRNIQDLILILEELINEKKKVLKWISKRKVGTEQSFCSTKRVDCSLFWLKVNDGRYRGGKYRNYSQLKDINNKFRWNEYEY